MTTADIKAIANAEERCQTLREQVTRRFVLTLISEEKHRKSRDRVEMRIETTFHYSTKSDGSDTAASNDEDTDESACEANRASALSD
jgi:hypothetical protein